MSKELYRVRGGFHASYMVDVIVDVDQIDPAGDIANLDEMIRDRVRGELEDICSGSSELDNFDVLDFVKL